jgi:hypothetical protein
VKRQLTLLFSLVILASMVLVACGGAAPEAPVETAALNPLNLPLLQRRKNPLQRNPRLSLPLSPKFRLPPLMARAW